MSHREIEAVLAGVSKDVREILSRALSGEDLDVEHAVRLFDATGRDLLALTLTADTLRTEQVGDAVTYVVNRNINFTNVCVKTCRFCAFARGVRSEQGYFLPEEEVVRRVLEARQYGATEVCIQAGLAPTMKSEDYVSLIRAIKTAAPDVHIHALSPEELKYAADIGRKSIRSLLTELKDAGIGSLPGTSAEILDDSLRKRIAPTRISTADWMEVISTAHELGIPTTSTMMFGHVETPRHRANHLLLLRSMQRATKGFTEFVPLSFVHEESPLFAKAEVKGVHPGPTGNDVIRLYAIARLVLGRDIPNLQASWVKEGLRTSQFLLACGVNDLGGTLMNESISTTAGAQHGQLTRPSTLRGVIRDAGRLPVERTTLYAPLRSFTMNEADDPADALDGVTDPNAVFGTYSDLARDARFRYEPRNGGRRLDVIDA
jgi:7,8-didemethyl-8-hydroxy-5-deazariboflavin synthase CofH subunit